MKTLHYSATVQLPVHAIDLHEWLTTISENSYKSFASGHLAIGLFENEGVNGMVNAESIGGNLLIQHYTILTKESDHVLLYSERSDAYLFHLVKVHVSVTWEMKVIHKDDYSCTFVCEIGVTYPNRLLAMAAKLSAVNYFLRRHLDEEGKNFARDIERKFRTGKPVLLRKAEVA